VEETTASKPGKDWMASTRSRRPTREGEYVERETEDVGEEKVEVRTPGRPRRVDWMRV
jgi:hypothetical protein